MAMQINLAPDLKQERLKIKRGRQITSAVIILVLIAAIIIPVVLTVFRGSQALILTGIKADIEEHKQTLNSEEELSHILSVQQNLRALPGLYDQRTYYSQLFDLLPSVTPIEAELTNIEVSELGEISFTGKAPNHALVEKFYAALRYSGVPEEDRDDPAVTGNFSNVMLESVSAESGVESSVNFVLKAQLNQDIINKNANEANDETQE